MRTAKAALTGGSVLAALLLAVGFSTTTTSPVSAQAGTQGQWRTLTTPVPINPVHVALLRTGQVLIVAGSGNVAAETNFQAAVWDPAAETVFQTRSLGWDMFCNGMVTLHDGRVLINGGNLKYDPFWGEPKNAVFDPATGLFTDVQNMLHGRWYPTVTTLGDGRVMTFSGLSETGGTNSAVEIYTVGSGWSPEFPAGWTPPLYPRMHLSTDGRVFYAGSTRNSRFFNPSSGTWTPTVAQTNYSGSRSYGTSVLLPLTPANGYTPRVMILGGGNPSTTTTEIIDLSAATPVWQFGPPMSQPRIQLNATLLPSGKVLATGGSQNDEDAVTASRNADLFDPVSNTFSPAGANVFPRLYHSNALLLADATVLLIGGNPQRGNYEGRLEIYSPAYLFNGDGTVATRPTITSVTPAVSYASSFQVQTPDAANIASVVLVRPGTPTHAFDMDQRLVGLTFTAGSGVLNVTAPPHGNIAPPGYYMLFVLNNAGVPSVAKFVKIATSVPNQAPVASITSPAGNVSVNPGGTVSFSGSGTDSDGTISAYSWTFPGGAPASSAVATPGSVSYSTPGTYAASFTVTDDKGLASQPATRTITVSNFTVAATPASQPVTPGQSATYTATVTPSAGFTGTVAFSVTGLPAGATPTFTPPSVVGSGSTSLVVSTGAGTPSGSYPLIISGTSGPITRTANVTLVVNAAPVAAITSPAGNVTVNPGGTVSFSGSGTDSDGTISAYSWTFPGGVPASSAVASPGSVSYSTPGTYAASFTVTDDKGLASQPVTRTITVSNFAVGATPSSQQATAGQSATYTATVTPASGFTGTVAFSVTGLPAGATPTFTPPSVAGSGSTSLVVSTTAATAPGTYPLVISGTSGPVTRTANVTLVVVVSGDFAISVTPASRTLAKGGATTYTVTIAADQGFSSPVNLTVTGVPAKVTGTFSPASLPGSGTSVLTISSQKGAQKATRTLTITGTGGGRTHSVTVTLVIQ